MNADFCHPFPSITLSGDHFARSNSHEGPLISPSVCFRVDLFWKSHVTYCSISIFVRPCSSFRLWLKGFSLCSEQERWQGLGEWLGSAGYPLAHWCWDDCTLVLSWVWAVPYCVSSLAAWCICWLQVFLLMIWVASSCSVLSTPFPSHTSWPAIACLWCVSQPWGISGSEPIVYILQVVGITVDAVKLQGPFDSPGKTCLKPFETRQLACIWLPK